jgi:hypothetical protein
MLGKKPQKADGVTIYVLGKKAYIPSHASYPSIVVQTDPIYITSLDQKEMKPAIKAARESGWTELQEPESRDQLLKEANNVLLRATKLRNWKQLARSGPAYMIAWTHTVIRLSASCLDKRGRYEFPKSKEQIFPVDTPLELVIQAILVDVDKRRSLKED